MVLQTKGHYVDIADHVRLHITERSNKDTIKETLKWDITLLAMLKKSTM